METIDWLLDSDPAIRWQVMRDLLDTAAGEVDAERARVATEGWGARLLALQGEDGNWGGGAYFPKWTSTTWTLLQLRALGLDPATDQARRAVAKVRENTRFEHEDEPYFEGETEPCINGQVVAVGSYFGEDVRGVVDRLLGDQMADGGWNCWQEFGSTRGSFHSTIDVLEGLLEFERATGGSGDVTAARLRGQEYLLDRRMLRRISTNEVIEEDWGRFAYPTYWHYDVLRGLDYLRAAGVIPDERVAEAVGLVNGRRAADGRWPLDKIHEGEVHFAMDEGVGMPSRWITLRALRVLRWAG